MGHIYLYYGTGGGKTANGLGLALRAVGHGQKVIIIQFMKWWTKTGEYLIKDKLKPYYQIYQFGRPGWIRFSEGDKEIQLGGMNLKVRTIEDSDRKLARKALEFAEKTMLQDEPLLLILDEICLAVHSGLLTVEEVLDFLKKTPMRTNIVMTGRYAPKELVDRADFVNEIVDKKSPEKFISTEGIQY